MASNGFTLAAGNCDIEITGYSSAGALETHGYHVAANQRIMERRGNRFVEGSGSNDGRTYQDDTAFSRLVFDWFMGAGQAKMNKLFGGMAGQGGDPSFYMDGDCWTLDGTTLAPGMRREMIFPTGTPSPLNANAYDSAEQPLGVMPDMYQFGQVLAFNAGASVNLTALRVLCKFPNPAATGITVTATIRDAADTLTIGTFNSAVINDPHKYTNFKFITCTGGPAALVNGTSYLLKLTYNANVAFGTYPAVGLLAPYAQFCNPAAANAPYKYWSSNAVKFEQLNNAGTYVPVGINSTAYFLPNSPGTAERALGGTFTNSLVFNNRLYYGHSAGTSYLTAAQAATGAAATATDPGFIMGAAVAHEGYIFCYRPGSRTIDKWAGELPATTRTTIIAADKFGKGDSNGRNVINNLIIFRGRLIAAKPEGLFLVQADLSKITSNDTPTISKIWDAGELEHINNGKYLLEWEGQLVWNVGDEVRVMTFTEGQGNDIQVIQAPALLERLTKLNYVNGLAKDGDTLFVSYNNRGVWAYRRGGWHRVTNYFEQQTGESNPSGLSFLLNPTNDTDATDYLYTGDGRTVARVKIPSARHNYTTQYYYSDQNNCMYWISSIWDGDMAELRKYIEEVTIRGAGAVNGQPGFNYKMIAAVWQSGDANWRTVIDNALNTGLKWDYFDGASPALAGAYGVYSNPTYFASTDLANQYTSTTKVTSTDRVARPVSRVSCAFILYGFANDQGAGTRKDPQYLESIIIKYWPTQKWLANFQTQLDFKKLLSGYSITLSPAQYTDSLDFFQTIAWSQTPSLIKFKDFTGRTREITGFIDTAFESIPLTQNTQGAHTERTPITIIPMQGED